MTEAELLEALALVAQFYRSMDPKPTRWEKIAYQNRLEELGVKLNKPLKVE
jgi:hypothetical protein